MDYKKTNAPTNTVTRNMMDLCEDTGNVYRSEDRCKFHPQPAGIPSQRRKMQRRSCPWRKPSQT